MRYHCPTHIRKTQRSSVPVEKHAGTAEETNMATNIETNIMAIDLALNQQSVVSRT